MTEDYSEDIEKLSAAAKMISLEKDYEDELCARYSRNDGRVVNFSGEPYVPNLPCISLGYPDYDRFFNLDILMIVFNADAPEPTARQNLLDQQIRFLVENFDGWLRDPENFVEKYASIADVVPTSVEEMEEWIGNKGEHLE